MSLIQRINEFNRSRLIEINQCRGDLAFTNRAEIMADFNRSRALVRRFK